MEDDAAKLNKKYEPKRFPRRTYPPGIAPYATMEGYTMKFILDVSIEAKVCVRIMFGFSSETAEQLYCCRRCQARVL